MPDSPKTPLPLKKNAPDTLSLVFFSYFYTRIGPQRPEGPDFSGFRPLQAGS